MCSISRITIMACVALLLAGCRLVPKDKQIVQADLPRVEAPIVSEEQEAQLRDGNNSFAFDLYHAITQEKTDNLIYSPYSIWLAFSMVYAGAQGETESQMAGVFHFLSQESQHVTINAIDQRLQAFSALQAAEDEGTPFQLGLANAVWSQQGYAFKQPYLDLLATQYGAGVRVLDFQSSAEVAREAINAWVNENTDGRIKEIAAPGSISAGTRLVLTNAILFKAGWAYKFDQQATSDGLFTLIDGKQVNTPLMHLRAPLDYVEDEDYQAVRLPYVNQKVEMWIIMPAEGHFNAIQDGLDSDLMNDIQQQVGMKDVTLSLPSFDFESELPLNELLEQMGLTNAFCPAGDYGGIAEGGGLCIDQAVHKATITVDEQGTEATAATMVAMPVSIMEEIEMTVDRPFIFAIVARESGLILFLGQVLDPTIH
jgi:serpin B